MSDFQDILFDARSHEVIKFILHTNFPGNYDFNSYHRCAFCLRIARPIPSSQAPSSPNHSELRSANSSAPIPTNSSSAGGGGKNGKSPKMKKNKQNQQNSVSLSVSSVGDPPPLPSTNLENPRQVEKNWISVTYDTHWEEVKEFASSFLSSEDRIERPVVLTRSSSNNPFGSSLCYGVQDMIFEVMSNDHIASVTLYQVIEE